MFRRHWARLRLLGALAALSLAAVPAAPGERERAEAALAEQDARARYRQSVAVRLAGDDQARRDLEAAYLARIGDRDRADEVSGRSRALEAGGGARRPGDRLRDQVDKDTGR